MTNSRSPLVKTLNEVGNLNLKISGTMKNSSAVSRRPLSVLLTSFSSQEWRLAGFITELMEIITNYPNIATSAADDRVQKPSQIVVSIAAALVGAVKQLSTACVESITNIKSHSVIEGELTDLFTMKSTLHKTTVATVDKIKDELIKGNLESTLSKQILLEFLIDISNQANEIIEFSTSIIKVAREASRKSQFEMDHAENHNNNADDTHEDIDEYVKDKREYTEPDGEGLALAVSGIFPSGICCYNCNNSLGRKERVLQYLGSYFHWDCFKCISCHSAINSTSFLTKEDAPICLNCSPRCHACTKAITSDCFLALEETFHLHCFRCLYCSSVIPPEDKFYRKNGEPVCVNCMSNPRESVFKQTWNPRMNTRFSMVLNENETKIMNAILEEKELDQEEDNQPQSALPIPPPRRKIRRASDILAAPIPSAPIPPKRKDSMSEGTPLLSPPAGLATNIQMAKPQSSKDCTFTDESIARKQYNSSPIAQAQIENFEHATTLKGVLSSDYGIECLIQYCSDEFCVEKLFFWMDVEQYRKVCELNPNDTLHFAKAMFDKYINIGAEMEITIHPKVAFAISTCLTMGQVSAELYDQPQQEIFGELQANILPRFLESMYGHRYLQSTLVSQAQRSARLPSAPLTLNNVPSTNNILREPHFLVNLTVSGFEKRYKPEKHYVYEVNVKRAIDVFSNEFPDSLKQIHSQKGCPVIYRTHTEFQELHVALGRYFPDSKNALPYMPGKNVSLLRLRQNRSGKALANELNLYLEGIFKMNQKIVQSAIMQQFVKPTKEDLDNAQFNKRLSGVSNNITKKYY